MSFNEIQWWQAYSCCRPLASDRLDIMEARICASLGGGDPNQLKIDWFKATPENDEETRDIRDAKRLKHVQKLKAERELKEKEHGPTN